MAKKEVVVGSVKPTPRKRPSTLTKEQTEALEKLRRQVAEEIAKVRDSERLSDSDFSVRINAIG